MNIYWDIQNHEIVKSLENSQVIQRLNWILRDQVPVTLYLVTPAESGQGYTAQEAPAGYSVKFTIKVNTAAGLAGDALAFQGVWTLSGTGTSAKYEATVDLNTEGLIAALAGLTYKDLKAEFVLQDANGNHRDSTQADCRISADVYRGTESAPAAAAAPWPYMQWYTDESGNHCVRILNDLGQTVADLKPTGV